MSPLVSAIMPTCGRRQYIPQAIECFLAQTYPSKELIVIDDGPDRIGDLIPPGGLVRYYHLQDRRTIGEKRNVACGLANGEFICHWDDDDVSHPDRMKEQVRLLVGSELAVTGYCSMIFYDEREKKAWLYQGDGHYALGTSLMYRREYWRAGKFPDISIAEDGEFIRRAQEKRSIVSVHANDRMVARIHGSNTCDKKYLKQICSPVDYSMVKALVGEKDAAAVSIDG